MFLKRRIIKNFKDINNQFKVNNLKRSIHVYIKTNEKKLKLQFKKTFTKMNNEENINTNENLDKKEFIKKKYDYLKILKYIFFLILVIKLFPLIFYLSFFVVSLFKYEPFDYSNMISDFFRIFFSFITTQNQEIIEYEFPKEKITPTIKEFLVFVISLLPLFVIEYLGGTVLFWISSTIYSTLFFIYFYRKYKKDNEEIHYYKNLNPELLMSNVVSVDSELLDLIEKELFLLNYNKNFKHDFEKLENIESSFKEPIFYNEKIYFNKFNIKGNEIFI
jgi:hypothetical protein